MAVLDGSIANVALPTIARELRIDAAASIWIVNAYQLATTMSLIAFASLGDSIGYRPVYTGGLVAFTLGSLGCALSHSLLALALARGFQGFGGAALMSVGPALYRTIFPNRMLGTALGISAFVVASSAAAGPTLGGAILAVAPWPWLFIVNLPLGAFDALLAARALPKESGRGGRFDIPSALLAGPTLALLVIGLDGISRRLAPLAIAALLLASFVFGFAFVERQRRLPEPMLPLALFGNRRFSLAAATSLCSFGAQGIAYVALPFLFQSVDGYSPLDSGLLFTPWPIAIAFAAPFAGRLADRIAAPILATVGLGIFALGLVALATLPPHAQPLDIVLRAIVCGLGFGFFQAPNNRELLGSAPRARSGSASGILATARVTGQSLGAALVAIALGTAAAGATLGAGHIDLALDGPVRFALALAAAVAALAALVSAFRLRGDLALRVHP